MYRASRSALILLVIVIESSNYCKCEILKKSDRYLSHIFNKYGSHGYISFEGLEHLMHNLGLGGLEFSPSHTVDEHRPEGFKVPDIIPTIIEDSTEDKNLFNVHNENEMPSKQTDRTTTLRTESEPIKMTTEVPLNEDGNNVETNIVEKMELSDDMWNIQLWQDAIFKQMHDPKHRHPRHHDHGLLNTCLSPSTLLQLVLNEEQIHQHNQNQQRRLIRKLNEEQLQEARFKRSRSDSTINNLNDDDHQHHYDKVDESSELLSSIKITPSMFVSMCPALIVQLDQKACSDVVKMELGRKDKAFTLAWIYAIISILIISMCGLAGVAIVPLTKSMAYQDILRFLVALAVGTLCGDALMHLLPHAMTPHTHDSDESATLFENGDVKYESIWLCACAFATALFMFTLETLLPLFGQKSHHHHGHSHHNTTDLQMAIHKTGVDMDNDKMKEAATHDNVMEISQMLDESQVRKTFKLSPVAFMVLLGDGLHNITDGMAIGAAFALDPVTGMATAFAVLCHELPHELGDFALLLQTGVSIRKAILFNIFSSILSVMGMVMGLIVAGIESSFVRWIYAGTAGTFLYIALADLVPEMRRVPAGSELPTVRHVLTQVGGILAGGVIMLIIALFEDNLRMLFE